MSQERSMLVIDDEERVGQMLSRGLKGHEVTITTRGLEALKWIAEGKSYDVVLCDVMMPEMNGPELVEALRHKRPGQKYLFMSGYEALTLMQLDAPVPDKDLIRKPFTSHELLKRVRSVLDQTA